MKYMLKNIKEYLMQNISIIIMLLLAIMIGVIISVGIVNRLSIESQEELCDIIKKVNEEMLNIEYETSFIDISINTIVETVSFTIILLLLCSSIVFNKLIYILFLYKGYCLGVCVSTNILLMGNVKGTIYSLILYLIPYTIFVIFEIFIIVLWNNFRKDIMGPNRYFNIKSKYLNTIIITSIIYLIMLVLLILSNLAMGNVLVGYVKII